MECKSLVLADTYGCVVQFEPNEDVMKEKQFASSTKWGSRESIALLLMKCLRPTVSYYILMDNYFTPFHLLNHLEVSNIRVTDVLKK